MYGDGFVFMTAKIFISGVMQIVALTICAFKHF